MSKLKVPVKLSRDGHRGKTFWAIVDSGSSFTLFPRSAAELLHLRPPRDTETEDIEVMGSSIPFWFTELVVHVPDTDCFAEKFLVGFAAGTDDDEDLLHPIIGVDLMQVAGGILDFGHNRHAIACDPGARGKHVDVPVVARRKRLNRAG
jgi:hypothetical protein